MRLDKQCSLDFWGDGSPKAARVERKRRRKRMKAIDREAFPGERDLAFDWHEKRDACGPERLRMFFDDHPEMDTFLAYDFLEIENRR